MNNVFTLAPKMTLTKQAKVLECQHSQETQIKVFIKLTLSQ